MAVAWEEIKDPDEKLDFGIDWSSALDGDEIVSSVWTVPTGLTEGVSSYTATMTTIWLMGGTLDADYSVHNRITTLGGRIRDQTCTLKVRAK